MKRHRWGEKTVISASKSEQPCLDCGIVKVHRREHEGPRALFWTEFWRALDKIDCSNGTPACEPVEVSA